MPCAQTGAQRRHRPTGQAYMLSTSGQHASIAHRLACVGGDACREELCRQARLRLEALVHHGPLLQGTSTALRPCQR